MTVTAIRALLTDEQLAVLAAMLDDAIAYREPSGDCTDCCRSPGQERAAHAADWDRCDDYLNLARELGIDSDPPATETTP